MQRGRMLKNDAAKDAAADSGRGAVRNFNFTVSLTARHPSQSAQGENYIIGESEKKMVIQEQK